MTALVIAYGNPLRGDDGAGLIVAEHLRRVRPDVRTVALQQLVPELAASIADAPLVVYVDAGVGGAPGTVGCHPVWCGSDPVLDHALSPATLLSLTRLAYGRTPPAWLVRVDGADFGVGRPLSAQVSGAIPLAVQTVDRLLDTEFRGTPTDPAAGRA